jgi:hypothetical protein
MDTNMNTSTAMNNPSQKKSMTDHMSETASKAWSGFTDMFKQPSSSSNASLAPTSQSSPTAHAPVASAPSTTMGGKKKRSLRAKVRAMKGGKSKKYGKKHGKSKKGKKFGKSTKRNHKKRSRKQQ